MLAELTWILLIVIYEMIIIVLDPDHENYNTLTIFYI